MAGSLPIGMASKASVIVALKNVDSRIGSLGLYIVDHLHRYVIRFGAVRSRRLTTVASAVLVSIKALSINVFDSVRSRIFSGEYMTYRKRANSTSNGLFLARNGDCRTLIGRPTRGGDSVLLIGPNDTRRDFLRLILGETNSADVGRASVLSRSRRPLLGLVSG